MTAKRPPPTAEYLSAIRARCDAATEGPWFVEYDPDDEEWGFRSRAQWVSDNPIKNDCEFSAHARDDLPWLLDYVAELELWKSTAIQSGLVSGLGFNCEGEVGAIQFQRCSKMERTELEDARGKAVENRVRTIAELRERTEKAEAERDALQAKVAELERESLIVITGIARRLKVERSEHTLESAVRLLEGEFSSVNAAHVDDVELRCAETERANTAGRRLAELERKVNHEVYYRDKVAAERDKALARVTELETKLAAKTKVADANFDAARDSMIRVARLEATRAPHCETIDLVFGRNIGADGILLGAENMQGESVSVGTWRKRPDGYWALRIPVVMPAKGDAKEVE